MTGQDKETAMLTMLNQEMRHGVGTVAAMAVIAFGGLALEFGHAGVLPEGRVEVGELQPVNLEQLATVALPGVVVTASRLNDAGTAPVLRDLPGNEVRLAQAAAADDAHG
jgi:hypothetical protein